ncbi:unnamed protein product [Peniophora sp. CBMAI 1063]|nr:unnamed protein product [Peniophora sp. CBMAI 1063]
MTAADPTYPLYPFACVLGATVLLFVLLTSFVRQSWNLGVAFLCFWLFWENVTLAINAVAWADNGDIKMHVYCDIVTHVQLLTSIVKPMATLIITRRLYLITSLSSVEPPTNAGKRGDLAAEWILGLGIPVLVAGPLYYVVQWFRFEVIEGFGCTNSIDGSILSILLMQPWAVIPPLVSVTFYYPHIVRVFYRHSRDINDFCQSDDSVARTNYMRILALASIDVLFTLPIGAVTIVLSVKDALSFGPVPFYYGWAFDHSDWQPESISYARLVSEGTADTAAFYFNQWSSPVLAFAIFALFGVTSEARASYWQLIGTIGRRFGWNPTPRTRKALPSLGDMEFGERPTRSAVSLSLESNPSFINTNACARDQAVDIVNRDGNDIKTGSEKDAIVEGCKATHEATQADEDEPGRRRGSYQVDLGDASAIV